MGGARMAPAETGGGQRLQSCVEGDGGDGGMQVADKARGAMAGRVLRVGVVVKLMLDGEVFVGGRAAGCVVVGLYAGK